MLSGIIAEAKLPPFCENSHEPKSSAAIFVRWGFVNGLSVNDRTIIGGGLRTRNSGLLVRRNTPGTTLLSSSTKVQLKARKSQIR
jgi:hypothetical protein